MLHSRSGQCGEINQAACDIAKEVSRSRGTILAGGITQTEVYNTERNKESVQAELGQALQVLLENDVDLIIVEVAQGGFDCP